MFVAPGDGRAGQWGRWNLNPARPWWCEGKVNVVNLVNCRPAQGNNSSRLRSPSSLLVTPHFWHVSSFDVSEALIYIFAPGYCCAHSKFSFCHIPSCPFFWSASTRPCHQLRSLIQGQEIQVLPHWDADCSRILRTLVSFLLPLILFCCKKHYIYIHTHLQTHTHTHTFLDDLFGSVNLLLFLRLGAITWRLTYIRHFHDEGWSFLIIFA